MKTSLLTPLLLQVLSLQRVLLHVPPHLRPRPVVSPLLLVQGVFSVVLAPVVLVVLVVEVEGRVPFGVVLFESVATSGQWVPGPPGPS